ncbi:MAG TPA: helix-turn-helix domain-containing protein [Leptolyngbya sp.]|jgi:hypothetical protein|nr:helix-turn-helix domain-containing protein [Leptolyngbya sp.]
MLAQDSIMVGVSGTGEESSEGFRALLSQIEAELCRSEVYRRALESLEAATLEGTSAQFCLKSVGREAIRLALRELAIVPPSKPPEPVAKPPEPVRPKKIFLEPQLDQRQDGLKKLGEQIRAARHARSMSIAELHSKTLVPVHQIRAIEAGHGAHLPEDIYLRGFIQRMAKALNLDSGQLLALLPTVDPVKAVLPTWYHPTRKSSIDIGGISLKPVHLYLGYAAVLSGGFFWLSHQSAPPAPSQSHAPQIAPATQSEATTATHTKVSAVTPVSAPERL